MSEEHGDDHVEEEGGLGGRGGDEGQEARAVHGDHGEGQVVAEALEDELGADALGGEQPVEGRLELGGPSDEVEVDRVLGEPPPAVVEDQLGHGRVVGEHR